MTGEARILACRRSAENPPRRHRVHRDDPQFGDEDGSDFILGALCVSVVKIYAKQSQFPLVKGTRASLDEVQSHPVARMVLKNLAPADRMGYNRAGHRYIRAY